MNISFDGVTVRFKTEPEELFLAEKSGAKPNTVRIIDKDEYEMLNTHTPKKIIIQYQEEIFSRTLTNLYFAKLFGHVIVIFSWTHPKKHPESDHVHVMTKQDPYSPLSHSMSLNEPGNHSDSVETCQSVEEPSIDKRFAAITISNGTLALLQSIAHGRTMNMVIRELYEAHIGNKELYGAYTEKKSTERGPLHD
jgi:hypothetical protein